MKKLVDLQERPTSEQGTKCLVPSCPLFGGSTVVVAGGGKGKGGGGREGEEERVREEGRRVREGREERGRLRHNIAQEHEVRCGAELCYATQCRALRLPASVDHASIIWG